MSGHVTTASVVDQLVSIDQFFVLLGVGILFSVLILLFVPARTYDEDDDEETEEFEQEDEVEEDDSIKWS